MSPAVEAERSPAGLAHVAAVSFLAARATPSAGFLISLPGGVALARAGARLGPRPGYGASIAALLQSVAIMGPARLGTPLTQALSAPLLGRMHGRGRGFGALVLACAGIRTVQNALGVAFFVFVVTGLEAYVASYDEVVASVVRLPQGEGAALAITVAGLLLWSVLASTVQVLVYRRGLDRWVDERDVRQAPETGAGSPAAGEAGVPIPAASRPLRFDPRAVTLAAAIAFILLLSSTSVALLAAVAAWLLLATVAAARLEREILPAGLALAAILALSGFGFSLVGGLGLDVALRRGARAGLLVLVATWLRAAAGSEGLREVARRSLRRLRWIPSLDEAARVLDAIGATPRLAAAGRELVAALRPVRKRPQPLAGAVLRWVRAEAARFRPAASVAGVTLRLRVRDVALVTLAALTGLALLTGP